MKRTNMKRNLDCRRMQTMTCHLLGANGLTISCWLKINIIFHNIADFITDVNGANYTMWGSNSTIIMTSSNGNIFRVNGPLWGEFAGRRLIPRKKGQWHGALMFPLICAWTNTWANNEDAGDLRRHRVHCDVIVMMALDMGAISLTIFFCNSKSTENFIFLSSKI